MENWTLVKDKAIHTLGFNHNKVTNISKLQIHRTEAENTAATTNSTLLQSLLTKNNTDVVKNRQLMNTDETETEITVTRQISKDTQPKSTEVLLNENVEHTKINPSTVPVADTTLEQPEKTPVPKSANQEIFFKTTSLLNSEYALTLSTDVAAPDTTQTQNTVREMTTVDEVANTNKISSDLSETERIAKDEGNLSQRIATAFHKETIKDTKNQTHASETQYLQVSSTDLVNLPNSASSVEKGYLVFSENCRIPDIDPWHKSILKFVEKVPPLDCSEDYKPLVKTSGNLLILDEKSILERTAGDNYTCCYKPIFRILDGQTDDAVEYSKCISMSQETVVNDEFIQVICKYTNETEFYQDFYSFIFDKPKVEQRCSNASKSLYSVLIIGVDSVSRLNMHRQLNATANYLLKDMEAIEMYGYNKVGDNTFPNLIPLLTGYDERELPTVCWESDHKPLDNCSILWKKYAKEGYRTFYAEDSPHISTFNYIKQGFYHQPTDYYFRPFILAYENKLGRDKPLNCYQCVGSTSETEAILNWAEKFAFHFSNRPYFAFSWINSLTHDFLNMGSAGDDMYERFLRNLHQTGALNKTIVILISDHGMRWGGIRNTYVGRLEERLPMLLIALPQVFKQEYPDLVKILKENSHRLITPYDLHATLKHLLNLTNNWEFKNTDNVDDELSDNFTRRAQSLFHPVPEDRSCDDAFIEEHWCTCETSLNVDVKSDIVKEVAMFLLGSINELLKSASDKCALLRLDSILDARLWQPPTEHVGHSANDDIYTAVIQTNPSKAVFEGTVKISKPEIKYNLLGTISRLNIYGNQSSCIDNAILKKYCYCL